jgi:hypothetical protein
MTKRTVTTYLVLERAVRGWGAKARIVKASAQPPSLKRGQCAVRISIEVPDAAFEPVLAGPSLDETVIARVETIYPDGQSMYVAITHGELGRETTRVHVMKCALQPQQKKLKFGGRR